MNVLHRLDTIVKIFFLDLFFLLRNICEQLQASFDRFDRGDSAPQCPGSRGAQQLKHCQLEFRQICLMHARGSEFS